MSKNPMRMLFDHRVQEKSEVLSKNKISADPVADYEPQVVHAITKSDISRVLAFLNDLNEKGVSLCFMVENRSGSIKKVNDIIRRNGGRTASIVTSCEGIPNGYRKVYMLIYGIGRSKLPQLKEDLRGEAALLLYFPEQSRPRCHGEALA